MPRSVPYARHAGVIGPTARPTANVPMAITLTRRRAPFSLAWRMVVTGRGLLGAFVPSLKARLALVLSRMKHSVKFEQTTSRLLSGCSANYAKEASAMAEDSAMMYMRMRVYVLPDLASAIASDALTATSTSQMSRWPGLSTRWCTHRPVCAPLSRHNRTGRPVADTADGVTLT